MSAHPRMSALDAASEAVSLAQRRLFPFRLDRWLPLGFVAFLDTCGRGGGAPGGTSAYRAPSRIPSGSGGGEGLDLSSAKEWVGDHLVVILAIAALVLVVIIALAAIVLWLNSRGVFMYVDNVASGRFDVARPWREHRDRAWSYFCWSFGAALVGMAVMLVLLVPIGLLVLSLVTGGRLGGAIVGILLLALVVVFWVVAMKLFGVLLRDFAAPLQMKLDVPCGKALGVAWGLVKENAGTFFIYFVLKFAFAIAAGIVAIAAGCVTCCLGFLPVISQTLLQPVFYFERAWSLVLLKQAGYDLFPAGEVAAPVPPPAPPLPAAGG